VPGLFGEEADQVDFDVIVVGGGVAGTVCAYQLAQAGKQVVLIERGKQPGSKNLSGGVLYCRVMEQVFPAFVDEAPIERRITRNVLSFLNPTSHFNIDYWDQRLAEPGPSSIVRWQPYSSNSPPHSSGAIAGCCRKWSCTSLDLSPLASKSSSRSTTPTLTDSLLVYKPPTSDSLGAVADHRVSDTVDDLLGQADHTLDSDGQMFGSLLGAYSSLLRDERVYAGGRNHHMRVKFVSVSLDPDNLIALVPKKIYLRRLLVSSDRVKSARCLQATHRETGPEACVVHLLAWLHG